MIRTAATLFAKKTAIVAISGAAIIGGATIALAEVGDPPDAEGACGVDEVVDAETGLCAAAPDDTVPGPDGEGEDPTSCDDPGTTETEDCPVDGDPTDCDDPATTETEDCPVDGDPTDCDDPATTEATEECPVLEDGAGEEQLGTHPENHGTYVSEAAHGGGECAGLTGRDKGQCVSGVARSDLGKKGVEEPAADEPTGEQPATAPVEDAPADEAPAEEEPVEASTAPAKASGKPDHAGGGKGAKK